MGAAASVSTEEIDEEALTKLGLGLFTKDPQLFEKLVANVKKQAAHNHAQKHSFTTLKRPSEKVKKGEAFDKPSKSTSNNSQMTLGEAFGNRAVKNVPGSGQTTLGEAFAKSTASKADPLWCDINATLAAHNMFRAKHGAKPLTWSNDCAKAASKAAEENRAKNAMHHCHCSQYKHGQNIYWGSAGKGQKPEQTAVKAWYDEVNKPGYNFDHAGFSHGTGHFTQVVWRGTTQVGMSFDATGCYIVANYFPAGNMTGAFQRNVLREGQEPPQNEIDEEALRTSGNAIVIDRAAGQRASSEQRQQLNAVFTSCPSKGLVQNMKKALKEPKNHVIITYKYGSVELKVKRGGGVSTSSCNW